MSCVKNDTALAHSSIFDTQNVLSASDIIVIKNEKYCFMMPTEIYRRFLLSMMSAQSLKAQLRAALMIKFIFGKKILSIFVKFIHLLKL